MDATNHGADQEELPPLLEQLEERYDRQPDEALVDGGAEWVNALRRKRGFRQMPVRGQPKGRTVAVLQAIVHNIVRGVKLRGEAVMECG